MDSEESERAVETGQHSRMSPVVENYLQAIYCLREGGSLVTPTQLAHYLRHFPSDEGLGTTVPSVTGMVRRLVRQGVVELAGRNDIRLTAAGEQAAGDVVRRHRLAECMVVEVLGMSLVEAHRSAHRLEHSISHYLEEKLDARLRYPSTCPFGHPIPGRGDAWPRRGEVPLDEAEPGRAYRVSWVPEQDQRLLEYLVGAGLVFGAPVRVVEAAPYRGVVVLGVGEREEALGYQVAGEIRVVPAGSPALANQPSD